MTCAHNERTHKMTTTQAMNFFAVGFSSIFDIAPSKKQRTFGSYEDDKKNMASYIDAVGNDIYSAIEQEDEEKETCKKK